MFFSYNDVHCGYSFCYKYSIAVAVLQLRDLPRVELLLVTLAELLLVTLAELLLVTLSCC